MTNVNQHQEPARASGDGRILAIFDLDKTIIDTSASLAYRRPMAERGLLNTGEVLKMMAMLGNYMLSTHSEDNLESTKDALTSIIKDRESEPLRQVAQDALQEVITPFIYTEARELIEWHRKMGHRIAIVTASASIMVQPIAKELGVDHLFATELEEKDGRFTGAVTHFNKGHAKVERILQLVAEHGYNLGESYAYSDAATDIPMLELVGNPVAVNPDRPLKKRATESDWPIRQFSRPEPLFPQAAVLAGAGATLALLGIAATGLAMWLRGRDEEA
ncbi:HAD family hydrolase [Corynebacterium macclintockiae]|uniref:HAD family hydrolase n=1 Tax=Corynebacterium macclintockiae TaxID=2913501 RepID=UPI003EC09415